MGGADGTRLLNHNLASQGRAAEAPTCTASCTVQNVAAITIILRRNMRFATYLALAIAALVGACASNSDTVDPIYVSPSTFENLTCRQIGEEQKRITREEAANTQNGKATDATQAGVLKGAMEALEQVSIEKNCNIEFQHG
jgi:hypothetical protein